MQFDITFDYLCPFARNAVEAALSGEAAGRDWQVTYRPFSLAQVHVEEGEEDVFDDVAKSGVRALHWGIAVRDNQPERFPAAHRALFAARHDEGLDLRDEAVVRSALEGVGVDLDQAAEVVASGSPAKTLAAEHSEAVDRWRVFGVPTIIRDDVATFIRFMSRDSVEDLHRALELLDWADLNEFKRTAIPR